MNHQEESKLCPYLDSVTRTLLDFDFEHSCSVSLESGPHVYGCLVCGKFFRGKGPHTPAYIHAVESGHAVFVHLSKNTFHCLPDDYEIRDPSLADISAALKPTFNAEEIASLDSQASLSRDLFGRRYLPGFVGLNNLKKTDCINATLQALAHVRPLRDFFLKCGNGEVFNVSLKVQNSLKSSKKKRKRSGDVYDNRTKMGRKKTLKKVDPKNFSYLAQCFGEMIRKMWSNKRFKSTVDPHMFVQAVSVASKKRFTIGKQTEAGEFMAWLLHQVHIGIGGTKKMGSSIIHDIFQGEVEITVRQRNRTELKVDEVDEDNRIGSENEEEIEIREEKLRNKNSLLGNGVIEELTTDTNFLQLTLDIPEKPLFKDDNGGLVIPQEPLVSVLKKFDGVSFFDILGKSDGVKKKRYRLKKLPRYLILHLARFKRNGFNKEKNPTIVAFPVKNLDLSGYVFSNNDLNPLPTEEEVNRMNLQELKILLKKYDGLHLAENVLEKADLVEICKNFITKSVPDILADKYDLIANITHNVPAEVGREGQHDPLEEGSYRCHIQHKNTGQWYEMQDLHVQEIMPQQIGLSESYVLIFERKNKNIV